MSESNDRVPDLEEFKTLVKEATNWLTKDAKERASYYLERNAQLLEEDVEKALNEVAKGTKFATATIEKAGGQKFPDIVVAGRYGVEVKSSKNENWITLGGSVNESTRVKGVEHIFLIFGKLTYPIEFCSRPYEDCLSEVIATHYPRYKINMKLPVGETIFDKMNTTYDKLRLSSDSVDDIIDYYKSQLGDGERLWWIGRAKHDDHAVEVPIKIRLCSVLSAEEKKELMITGFAYFPDLLSESPTKYGPFSLWLVANRGVVSTSTRDLFSAGGRSSIETSSGCFDNIPQAIKKIHKNSATITERITNADESILRDTWCVDKIDNDDRIGQWIECVKKVCVLENNDTGVVFNAIFNRKESKGIQ